MAKIKFTRKRDWNHAYDVPVEDGQLIFTKDKNIYMDYDNERIDMNKNVYSTDEVVVGTWIDGKPIYRKVISTTRTGTAITIEHGVSSIETVVNSNIISYVNSITYPPNNGKYTLNIQGIGATNVTLNIDSSFNGWTIYIQLEYTKTTD